MKLVYAVTASLWLGAVVLGPSAALACGSHPAIGVGVQAAMANCTISGGSTDFGSCQIANPRTNVWVCQCAESCASFDQIDAETSSALSALNAR